MKKNLFMVAAVALMAMVSCNKEEINNSGSEQASDIVFVAEFDHEADTKIALGDLVDGVRKTTWVAGDQIKINGTEFSADEAGERTEFTTSSSFTETTTYRAVYPASSYVSTEAVEIPASQDGTFASASIAVAESSTTSLKFNNLVTILKFQVPVNCSKVTFQSTESLAGRITVNYTDGVMTPDYAGVTQHSKTINVTGSFVPGTDYYVAVKPGTHTFTVLIDDNLSKKSTQSVKVERSQIRNMGVLPEPAPPTTIYLDPVVWAADNAWFAAHFFGAGDIDKAMDDTDGDGIYEVTVPYGSTGVVFCRMNPQYKEFEWGHVWNQTEDLTVPASDDTKVYYVKSDWGTGAWHTRIEKGYVYLKPNSNWTEANARFAIYFFGKGDTWVSMTKVNNTQYYKANISKEVEYGYTGMIFCRMNPSSTVNNWDNKWNQSGNLEVNDFTKGNNLFTAPDGWWDTFTTTWSKINYVD